MGSRYHPAATAKPSAREPATRADEERARPALAHAPASAADAALLSGSPRLKAQQGQLVAAFGAGFQRRAAAPDVGLSMPALQAVVQRGQKGSKTGKGGDDGELPGHKRMTRINRPGALSYSHGKYELKKYRREVPIAQLASSEGDKVDEKLRALLDAEGYNKFYAVLVFEQENGTLKLIDGHHRVGEMQRRGEKTIPAYVIPPEVHKKQEAIKPWHVPDEW